MTLDGAPPGSGGQRSVAATIVDPGGDCVRALTQNPSGLWETVVWLFPQDTQHGPGAEATVTGDTGQGRIETRRCRTLGANPTDLDLRHPLHAGPPLRRIAGIESQVRKPGATRTQTRYFLCSGPARAADLRAAVRSHGSSENALHWVLDVPCGEDAARTRDRRGAENRARRRRRARNLRAQDDTVQSRTAQRERAADDPDCVPRLLNLM